MLETRVFVTQHEEDEEHRGKTECNGKTGSE